MSFMAPLPTHVHTNIIDVYIPRTLNGTAYTLIETAQGIPRPEVPAIVVWFGGPSQIDGAYSYLRSVVNKNFDTDDYWGERFYITLFVSLRAYDPDELAGMWLSFIRQVNADRRLMRLNRHGVEFKEILRSDAIPMDNTPESATGDQVFMAQVDLRFEYEVADTEDADYIRKVTQDIYVNEADTPMTVIAECKEMELTCGLKAYIEVPT